MPLIFPTSTRPLVFRPTYSAMRRRGISGIATSGAENALHIVRHNSASRSFPHLVTQKSGSRSLLPSVAQKSGSTNLLTMPPLANAAPVLSEHVNNIATELANHRSRMAAVARKSGGEWHQPARAAHGCLLTG